MEPAIHDKVSIEVAYHRYHFVIEFFLPVDKYGCEYEVRESDVRFSLKKKEADWWPRLLYENVKVKIECHMYIPQDLGPKDLRK